MHVAVIGGRLQGLEAAYLAGKAGWKVTLIDKHSDLPALPLCERFYQLDINESPDLPAILKGVDLIVPALENWRTLKELASVSKQLKIPLAFDLDSYELSASKSRSDRLFAEIAIPAPVPWPNCDFPVIVKPAESSGSEGVLLVRNNDDLKAFKAEAGAKMDEWIIQEYLEGPSYSIEVIGCRGSYLPLQVTELEMDAIYDCKRVLAPAELSSGLKEEFAEIAVKIARKLSLNGIMDVEVILHNNQLKVLEIDARLPSQTPTAVLMSSGINILELLAESTLSGRILPKSPQLQQAVIFEHIAVSPGMITVSGEHVVSSAGPLSFQKNFFGADEALTNYSPGRENWMATLIITGSNRSDTMKKRNRVIEQIKNELNITEYSDPVPRLKNISGSEVSGHDQAPS